MKETCAVKTRGMLEHIRNKAEKKGLVVNEQKTGLMCVSAAQSFSAKVSLDFNGQAVQGSESLKVLGVTVDSDCTFRTHVNNIAKKLRSRAWALGKLKKKGMCDKDLVKAYLSTNIITDPCLSKRDESLV